MFIYWWLESQLAGVWSMVWHWGLGIGVIILLVVAAFFTESIPFFGRYLSGARKDLLWAAAGIGLLLIGQAIGAHDEKKICVARTVVIEKRVTKIVKEVKSPKARKQDDPYDNPAN
jgi:hypothetical protein